MEPPVPGAIESAMGEMAFAASALAGTGGPTSGSPGDSNSVSALFAACARETRISSLNGGLLQAASESRAAQFGGQLEADAFVDLGQGIEAGAVRAEAL